MASLPDEQQYEEILCFDTGENIIHHVPISQATRETGKALSAFGDRPDYSDPAFLKAFEEHDAERLKDHSKYFGSEASTAVPPTENPKQIEDSTTKQPQSVASAATAQN
jgi:hypothetical protein